MLIKHGLSGINWVSQGGGGGGLVLAQDVNGGATNVPADNADTVQARYEANSITIGSGSNRVLVFAWCAGTSANAADLTGTEATFGTAARSWLTGTTMTMFGPFNVGGRRTQVGFAVLVNPPSGAGTVQIEWKQTGGTLLATALGAVGCWSFEFTGADQTVGNYAAFGAGATSATSETTSGTVAAGAMISALNILGADYTGEISASVGTLEGTVASEGVSGFGDGSYAFSSETGVSAGTDGGGFSWTTARDCEMGTISVPEA